MLYNYTIRYTTVAGVLGTQNSVVVMAGSSSGVVGGLMTGEQYQFSVSLTVSGGGRTYNGLEGNTTEPFTVLGEHVNVSQSELFKVHVLQNIDSALKNYCKKEFFIVMTLCRNPQVQIIK